MQRAAVVYPKTRKRFTSSGTYMYKFVISLLMFLSFGMTVRCAEPDYSQEIRGLLAQLDSVLAHKDRYIRHTEKEIMWRKEEMARRRLTDEQRFRYNRQIYDLMYVFNSDSAMIYANDNIAIAERLQRQDRVAEWRINKSFLLSATGLLKESYDVLRGIPTDKLSRELRLKYYTQAVYLYSHMGQYLAGNSRLRKEYYGKEQLYTDSLSAISRPDDALYLWYQGWAYKDDPEKRAGIIRQLKQRLSGARYDNRTDAMNAYILAKLCKLAGQQDDFLKYLIYSGMADIRSANRDIASMEELAKELFRLGDLDHAYAYIHFCQQNALYYKSRVRVVSIADMQTAVWQAYQQRSQQQETRLRIYTIIVTALSVVLIGALFYIYRQMRQLKASQKQLSAANALQKKQMAELAAVHKLQEEANLKLQELNTQLKDANSNLREASYIKEEYISQLFVFCSGYISKLDNYRKNINRKIKAGRYDDIRKQTGSESMVQDELKEFYHNFDIIFLHLYPDFVSDFNALLQPSARFELKNEEALNTQLRIYALVRLGINDSVKIAEFLHCSPQTVYNYRLKTRNNAIIPREDFAYTVSRLGKIKI